MEDERKGKAHRRHTHQNPKRHIPLVWKDGCVLLWLAMRCLATVRQWVRQIKFQVLASLYPAAQKCFLVLMTLFQVSYSMKVVFHPARCLWGDFLNVRILWCTLLWWDFYLNSSLYIYTAKHTCRCVTSTILSAYHVSTTYYLLPKCSVYWLWVSHSCCDLMNLLLYGLYTTL